MADPRLQFYDVRFTSVQFSAVPQAQGHYTAAGAQLQQLHQPNGASALTVQAHPSPYGHATVTVNAIAGDGGAGRGPSEWDVYWQLFFRNVCLSHWRCCNLISLFTFVSWFVWAGLAGENAKDDAWLYVGIAGIVLSVIYFSVLSHMEGVCFYQKRNGSGGGAGAGCTGGGATCSGGGGCGGGGGGCGGGG